MADDTGHLKVTRSVRNLFDSFLTSAGKEPLPQVRSRIVAHLDSHLPKVAAAQAQVLLDHYLSYEQARNALDQNAPDAELNPDERQSRLYVLEDLRSRLFSASERVAFFGDDLATERFAIARLRVLQDATLTPLDQASRLHALYAELPAALQTTLAEANQAGDLNVLMDGWRAQKGTPQELRAIRETLLGTQAANDLGALEKLRGLRLRKQRDYNVQRQAVMTDTSLSDIQRQQAINRLQDQLANDLAQLDAQQPGQAVKP